MSDLFSGLRVLDLSETIAGQFCARLFADFGADVWLGEPKTGSKIRNAPPVSQDTDAGSLLFFHLNTGKHSVTIDLTSDAGRSHAASLMQAADIIVLPDEFDAEAIHARAPRAITTSIRGFAAGGPRSGWYATEMVLHALAGMMINNGVAGREPLYGCGERASFAAGLAGYVGTLAALIARLHTGKGQHVDIDASETAAAMAFPYVMQFNYSGYNRRRADLVIPAGQILCRNGWVCIWVYNNRWSRLCATLDLADLENDPRFATPELRRENWALLFDILQHRLRDADADELVDRLQKADIIAAKSVSLTELAEQRHLRERDYWQWLPDGKRVLGPQWRMSRTPRRMPSPPPAPVSNDGPKWPQSSDFKPPNAPKPVTKGPLSGLRVVEMTTAWAGPMAGRILAYFGAESITVESPNRVNTWRLNRDKPLPENFPDGDPGDRHYDRSFLFNSQSINKKSLVIDLKKPEATALLRKVLAQTDIVICNFRPGTLEKLGIGYEELEKLRPGIIVMEVPAFGCTGPMARYAALGPTMEMAVGMSGMTGYPGGQPEVTGPSYLDPIGGFNAAAAALTAIYHHANTGEGQHIEVPQVEAAMHFIGAEILSAIETGENPERNGNKRPDCAPHDAFSAAGEDEWVVIAVRNDSEFKSLAEVMGQPGLARNARFATLSARKRNEAELDSLINAWTKRLSKHEVAARLQAAGVPAAPVQTPRDCAADPHLHALNFYTRLTHPDAGDHLYPGLPFHLSETPGSQRTAAPTFGGDNEAILSEIVGLSPEEIAQAYANGLISRIPVPGA